VQYNCDRTRMSYLPTFVGILRYLRTINPLSPNLIQIIFKNSVPTSMKTHRASTINIIWLMMFREINYVCAENHTKPINSLYRHIHSY
jgi:hypothetical protein